MKFEKPGAKKKPSKIRNKIRLHDIKKPDHCVRCGSVETVVPCHYEGCLKHRYGKGTGVKVDDIMVANLCLQCRSEMDTKPDKRDYTAVLEHDNEWCHLILQTIIWKRNTTK